MNDIHTLTFPNNKKLLIAIPNKNGSSTAISMIGFPIMGEFKYRKERRPIMRQSNWQERSIDWIAVDEWYSYTMRIAILRDPVKRFVSCYNDRIVNKNKHGTRDYVTDIEYFIENIDEICNKSSDIRNHSRAQYSSIGPTNMYTNIFTLEQLDTEFKTLIEQYSDTADIPLFRNKHSNKAPKLELTDDQTSRIQNIYSVDYQMYGSFFT